MVAEAATRITSTSLPNPISSSDAINITDGKQPDKTNTQIKDDKQLSSAANAQEQRNAGELTMGELEEAVGQLNDVARLFNKQYSFSVDEDTNQYVIKIMDSDSGDVIRQIPPENLLKLSSRIGRMVGMFINQVV